MRPLENIRVLDLSRVYAAPAGTMILGDLGAEVIRVEQPGGSDSTRGWGPYAGGKARIIYVQIAIKNPFYST